MYSPTAQLRLPHYSGGFDSKPCPILYFGTFDILPQIKNCLMSNPIKSPMT